MSRNGSIFALGVHAGEEFAGDMPQCRLPALA